MSNELIALGGIALAIIGAAAYARYTGNEASVDTDGDGEDELTFGDDNDDENTETGTTEKGCAENDSALHSGEDSEDGVSPQASSETADSVVAEGEEVQHRLENAENDDDDDKTNAEPAANDGDVSETVDVNVPEALTDIDGIGGAYAERLKAGGFDTPEDVYYASDENLTDVDGVGTSIVNTLRTEIGGIDHDNE